MIVQKNITIKGSNDKIITLDIFCKEQEDLPVVIYAHGFNGFKDWGNFDIIAGQFADEALAFIKFNFSHNGTSPDHPEEFVDLEAYSNNNYTLELDDLGCVIDWVMDSNNEYAQHFDLQRIFLLGHSMGGGICILKSAEDHRVKKLATWASISQCKTPWTNWPQDRLDAWNISGFEYSVNSRTKQNLPLKYQLFENYQSNQKRLDIHAAIRSLQIPVLLCHGSNDAAVPISSAYELQQSQPTAELFIVESDHVFGRKHPWVETGLPEPMQAVVARTINFFNV